MPLLGVECKSPDDGQRNWPKHVEIYSKNEYKKLVYLVGLIRGGCIRSWLGNRRERTTGET